MDTINLVIANATKWSAIFTGVSAVALIFYTIFTRGLLKSSKEQRNFDLRKEVYLEFIGDTNTFFENCFDIYAGETPSGVEIPDLTGLKSRSDVIISRFMTQTRESRYIESWADRINSICEKIKFCSSTKLQNEINVFADEFKKFHINTRGFLSQLKPGSPCFIDKDKWLEKFSKIRELKDKIITLMKEDLGIKY